MSRRSRPPITAMNRPGRDRCASDGSALFATRAGCTSIASASAIATVSTVGSDGVGAPGGGNTPGAPAKFGAGLRIGQNGGMSRILIGYLLGVASLLLLGGILLAAGSFDMSATHEAGSMERRIGGTAVDRSVSRRAPKEAKAPASSAELLRKGLGHYRENCVPC